MAKLATLIFEKMFSDPNCNNNTTDDKIFEFYLNKINSKLYEQTKLKESLNFVNHLIRNMSGEIFDLIAIKYFNKLNEVYKDLMNLFKNSKSQSTDLEVLIVNLNEVNYCLSDFFRIFHENFQNYNEKHKSLIKIMPNFLKIYFKLYEENFLDINFGINTSNNSSNIFLYFFKSFAICSISLINYFPTMMRSFEQRLEKILKLVFSKLIMNSSDKSYEKTACILYSMLIRLSHNYSEKLNLVMNKLYDNLNFFTKYLEPKTLKDSKNTKKNELKFNPNLFNFEEKDLKGLTLIQCNNIISLVLKLKRTILKSFPEGIEIDLNFSSMINQIQDSINIFSENNKSSEDYIVEGLSIEDHQVFKSYYLIESFKTFAFAIENFSQYFVYHIPNIKSFITKILTYFENDYMKFYEVYVSTLKFLEKIVTNLDSKIFNSVQEIIFKLCIPNFPELYVAFLERNDKTVVKVDQNYFKLSKLKSTSTKKKSISLIQLAKSESINEKIENYSNKDIETLLSLFLKSKSIIRN
jgi:hypothetical protein